jgi:hypothetical protein
MYTGHTQRNDVTHVGSSRHPQVAALHDLHLPQLHEKLNLVSIELKFIVGLYCN